MRAQLIFYFCHNIMVFFISLSSRILKLVDISFSVKKDTLHIKPVKHDFYALF